MSRVHLELMSKPRLIAMIRDAEARAEQWRRTTAAVLATTAPKKPRPITPEHTREDAEDILARLPIDPHADEHRAVLYQATAPTPRPRAQIEHGTYRGQRKHYRRGERPCDPCREAANEYERSRTAVPA